MKNLFGSAIGWVGWYILWYKIPPDVFNFGEPYHFEGNTLVVGDIPTVIGFVVSFFVLPVIGVKVVNGD